MKTFEKGHLACLKFEQRAHELGYVVSKPTIAEVRYDYILDDGQRLYRVQVKYGDGKSSKSEGAAVIHLERFGRCGAMETYKKEELDAIVAYIPKVDKLVWLPSEDYAEKNTVSIRVAPCKNCQTANVTRLEDYVW